MSRVKWRKERKSETDGSVPGWYTVTLIDWTPAFAERAPALLVNMAVGETVFVHSSKLASVVKAPEWADNVRMLPVTPLADYVLEKSGVLSTAPLYFDTEDTVWPVYGPHGEPELWYSVEADGQAYLNDDNVCSVAGDQHCNPAHVCSIVNRHVAEWLKSVS